MSKTRIIEEWKNVKKKDQETESVDHHSIMLSSFGCKTEGNLTNNKVEFNQNEFEENVKSDRLKKTNMLRKNKGVSFIEHSQNSTGKKFDTEEVLECRNETEEENETTDNIGMSDKPIKRRKSRLASVYLEEKLRRRSSSLCGGLLQHYIDADQKYMAVKAVIFFIVGLFICTIAFGFSYIGKLALKSEENDKWPTVTGFIVMIVFSMFFSIALLLSSMMRCIGALMIPAIFRYSLI